MQLRFFGKDQFDLDQQMWAWRMKNPKFRVAKTHPAEELPMMMSDTRPMQKIEAQNRASVLIEYENA